MYPLLLLTAMSVNQVPAIPRRTLPMPADAVELAWADAQKFVDPRGLRYVWLSGKYGPQLVEEGRSVSVAVNEVSRSLNRMQPVLLKNGTTYVARVDTKVLTNGERDWQEFAQAWDRLRYDPRFNAFVTKGQVELAGATLDGVSRRWVVRKGVRELEVESAITALKRDGVVRQFPQHLPLNWYRLAALLETEAPVVDYRYFLLRATTTIQDEEAKEPDPLWTTLYAGIYYDLAGVPDTLDELFTKLGVTDTAGGKKGYADLFAELPSDRRLAMFKSEITKRARRVRRFNTRPGSEHQGTLSITDDFRSGSIDVTQDPMADLAGRAADAHEVIWEQPNGLHGFGLYNGRGKRQDEVPSNIARDETPSGRLQCSSGCKFCHAIEGGWRTAPNHVATMLKNRKYDIFGDRRARDQGAVVQQLVGQYEGDFSTIFERGRIDYARAVLKVTGPWPGSRDQTDAVVQSSTRLRWTFDGYWYDAVTTQAALAELGYESKDDGDAKRIFEQLATARTPNGSTAGGYVLEPPVASGLRNGIAVVRPSWDIYYSYYARN